MPIPLALLAGGVAAASGAAGYATSRYNTDRTIQANKELAEYGYSKDLEMWNRANSYNTPQAQMQRLEDAKLNPNLVYGSGSVSGNSVPASTPKYQAPTVKYEYANPVAALPEMIGQYQNIKLQQAQIQNVEAQTKAVQQRTANDAVSNLLISRRSQNELTRGDLMSQQNRMAGKKLELFEGTMPYQFSIAQESEQKARMQNELLQAQLERQPSISEGVALQNQKRAAEILFSTYRNEFLKVGITSSDDLTVRMLAKMLSDSGLSDNQIRGTLLGTDIIGGVGKAVLGKKLPTGFNRDTKDANKWRTFEKNYKKY